MRGHIAKKGNRYYAVIYEGVDPGTGKSRHRWHAAGPTRRDAERLLAELVKKSHDGDYRAPDRVTLGQYLLDRWLPTKQTQLRPSTFESYRLQHCQPRGAFDRFSAAATSHPGTPRRLLRRSPGIRSPKWYYWGPERQDRAEHPYRPAQGLVGRGTKGHRRKERGAPRRPASA